MNQIPSLLLFVPANRRERYAGALGPGADAVMIDLEDAVAPGRKSSARAMMCEALRSAPPELIRLLVRINAIGATGLDRAQDNALTIDGQMVDAPVIARARQIRDDHERTLNRHT